MPRVSVSPRSGRCSRADRLGPWRRRWAPLVGVADAFPAAVSVAAAAAALWQDKRLIRPCFVCSS